jgi:hypothetical protein
MKKDKTAWKSFHKENGPTFALGGGRPEEKGKGRGRRNSGLIPYSFHL